jgi:hypothetical protein
MFVIFIYLKFGSRGRSKEERRGIEKKTFFTTQTQEKGDENFVPKNIETSLE